MNRSGKTNRFRELRRVDMAKNKLSNICKRIYFHASDRQALIMVTAEEIITYNFYKDESRTLFDFQNLPEQPEFFIFNEEQTVCIVTTTTDSAMVNIRTKDEHDLDRYFGITDIKSVIFYDDDFYILANKRGAKLGYYLLRIPEESPDRHDDDPSKKEDMFLMNYANKLDIGDVNLYVLKEEGISGKSRTELIITYKTIYINIYTINVIDLDTENVIFRHESACLWESSVSGFLNTSTLDYISLDSGGLAVMALSENCPNGRRSVVDRYGQDCMIHSMATC